MKPKLTLEKLDKVASIVAAILEERFGDEFVFDPIVVIPKVDDYYIDDVFPYIHTYIVFDGDQAKLDPHWTAGMARRLIPRLTEIGVDDFPVTSFVSKSGWKQMERKLRRELERELGRAIY